MNTALFTEMNWLAIVAGTVAYFALGAVWYSALFGKRWIAYHNINVEDPEMKKGVAGTMITSFVVMFITVICLAMIVYRLDLSGAITGLKLGVLTGAGFSATAISIGYLYTKKSFGLHLIDGGYHIAGQIAAAIILCVWR